MVFNIARLRISSSRRECRIVACLNGKNVTDDSDPGQNTSNAEVLQISYLFWSII